MMRKLGFCLALLLVIIAVSWGNARASICIDIEKHVSVDGGVTWHDADTPDAAPEVAVGSSVLLYRLIVTNCGSFDLTNVVVNDPTLGVTNYAVGDLFAGQSVSLDEGDIPQLSQPGRCSEAGEYENIAYVSGYTFSGDTPITDSDPAWVKCLSTPQPCIDIEKEISVDGGTTWYDADTVGAAPTVPVGSSALYRLVVRNCGNVDLTGVLVNDPGLGISDYSLGTLTAGQSVVLGAGDIPQLSQPGRCSQAGDYENVASVKGYYESTLVTDSDPAWIICHGGGEGCTPGYWKQTQHFDSWPAPYYPDMLFSAVFEDAFPGLTLRDVLSLHGGGLNALGRHTVAALLNAASSSVNYDLTPQQVIDSFNSVYPGTNGQYESLKNMFEGYNQQGCPLN
jgi:hypothetical protein